jgi:hypothetical protein
MHIQQMDLCQISDITHLSEMYLQHSINVFILT